jgi:hypothetical protein
MACASELDRTRRNPLNWLCLRCLLLTPLTLPPSSSHFGKCRFNIGLANLSFPPDSFLTFRLYDPFFSALDRSPYGGLGAFEPASHLADPQSNMASVSFSVSPG